MKRAFIIHGWRATPTDNWFPWLSVRLSEAGFRVSVPAMPDTMDPKPEEWVGMLRGLVGEPDRETCLIGHSLGAVTIVKYLEGLKKGKIGLAVLVAPWPNMNRVKDSAYSRVARRWMAKDPNFDRVKERADEIVAAFSSDDPFVITSNSEVYMKELGARVVMAGNIGHIVDQEFGPALEQVRSFYG